MGWPDRRDHGQRNHFRWNGIYLARIQRWWKKFLAGRPRSEKPLPPSYLLDSDPSRVAWRRLRAAQNREVAERERSGLATSGYPVTHQLVDRMLNAPALHHVEYFRMDTANAHRNDNAGRVDNRRSCRSLRWYFVLAVRIYVVFCLVVVLL